MSGEFKLTAQIIGFVIRFLQKSPAENRGSIIRGGQNGFRITLFPVVRNLAKRWVNN